MVSAYTLWAAITTEGSVSAAAAARSDPVTVDSCVVGVYLDLGDRTLVIHYTYAGSSYRLRTTKLGLDALYGVAARVLTEHECKDYRDDCDPLTLHYSIGYKVSSGQGTFQSISDIRMVMRISIVFSGRL